METFEVNGKPAFKILAKEIKKNDKSILFNCEGDIVWFPKQCVKVIDQETIMVQEWIYKQKFECYK